MSLNPSHHYQISFPSLSDYGIPKFHSPLGRITESKKRHSPVYRITESKKNVIPRSIGLRKVKKKRLPRFVGLRNIKRVSFSGLSDYGRSLKFYFLNNVISQYVG